MTTPSVPPTFPEHNTAKYVALIARVHDTTDASAWPATDLLGVGRPDPSSDRKVHRVDKTYQQAVGDIVPTGSFAP